MNTPERTRFKPPSNDPGSATDVLLVHTPFTGSIGIGVIVHIEPAGQFAYSRAAAQGCEILDELGWGNIRAVDWIGIRHKETPEPRTGKFVLFDESYAAPAFQVGKLIAELQRELEAEKQSSVSQGHDPELDRGP